MIYLYSGTPGSGKSLHQARDILDRLHLGKPTIANYSIDTSKVKKAKGEFIYCDNFDLTPEFLVDYARNYFKVHRFKEGSIALYIDEAQLLFNCREWDVKSRAGWIKFFTQHRKYGYNIYLVAQFDRMLDRQLRSLIEYEYIHRKVKNSGKWGWFVNLVAGGGLFVCVEMWYPMKERVGAEWFKYHKKYADIYDSYLDFGTGESVVSAEGSAHGALDGEPEKCYDDRKGEDQILATPNATK